MLDLSILIFSLCLAKSLLLFSLNMSFPKIGTLRLYDPRTKAVDTSFKELQLCPSTLE